MFWVLLSSSAHDGIVIKIEVQTNDEGSESLETPEPLMGQVEEHGFQDSELGDPCGEQPDLDMQEPENTLEESTEGSGEFSELKQMLVQQRNCAGQLGRGHQWASRWDRTPSTASGAWFVGIRLRVREEGVTANH